MSDQIEAQGTDEEHFVPDAAPSEMKPVDNVIKPSTEIEPGQEAKAPTEKEGGEEASHDAVGVGVRGASRPPEAS